MLRRLCTILAVLVAAIGLEAAPAVLDFSRSHTMEDVRRSGLRFKRLSDFGHSVAYVYEEDRDVIVLLPGGRKISQRITIAQIDEKDGILTRLDLCGGVMPQDQAYRVAGVFCDSFSLSREKLESWYQRNLGQQYSVERLGLSPNGSYYPRVTLGVKAGYSKLYPWCITLLLSWNWEKHQGWDEGRASREFSSPVIPEISLNPPSGLKYDIADDFRPFVESLNADFDQAKKTKSAQAQGAGAGEPAAPPGAASPKNPVAPGNRWWPWAIGAAWLSLLALLWFVIRRNRGKR